MTTNQSPYGGGGFPPPWLRDSTQSDDDGVEWGDPLPSQEPGSDAQESPGPSWDSSDSAEAGAEFSAPASGYQGHSGERVQEAPQRPPVDSDRPHDFASILDEFSGATETERKPSKKPRKKESKPPRPAKVKRERRPRSSTPSKKVMVPVVVIAGVALVGGLGFLGYDALESRGDSGDTVAASQEPEVSRDVPPGWSKTSAWSVPADVASNLAVRNDHIAYLNSSGVLVVIDGETGESVFSSTPTGANPDESRVVVSQIGDVPVAVVVQADSVTAWALDQDSPEAKVNAIPSSASVSSGGSGIMVNANGETWRMNSALGLEKVEGLPEGNTSLGMTDDGSIISGSPKGGWSINDGKKSTAVKVEMAEGAEGKVMYPTRASKGIVVAWAPTADKKTRAVGIYNASEGTLIATTTMDTAQVNLGLPLVVTDGGRLASAGSWLIDLERGETEVVEGWGTSIGTTSELYGKVSGDKFVWRGSGKPQAVAGDAATPWGVTADHAIIISTDEEGGKVIAALNKE